MTVANPGTSSVFFSSELGGGPNGLDLLDLNTQCLGVTIAPGASCAADDLVPADRDRHPHGDRPAGDNAAGSPQIINLTGTGTSTAGPTPMTVDTPG